MTLTRRNRWAAWLLLAMGSQLRSQELRPSAGTDSDGDGLSDALEQALLVQFAPAFQVGAKDCSNVPAEFWRGSMTPKVKAENGTIYGQAFPAAGSTADEPMVELHFYHLWKTDCGPHGHALDTEHASVLVRASGRDLSAAKWTAVYWYAAAHENTVCDVSQIARASTLDAEDHGARVWISPGKHASYLNETLCQRGCGADRCESMRPLAVTAVINLGEPGRPMNESAFIASSAWPLLGKMQTTNFPAEPLARLNSLPTTDIAWFRAGRHPAQQVIAVSGATEVSLAGSGAATRAATGSALASSSRSTDTAISVAGDSAGGALETSYRKTRHALGTSVRHVGRALGVAPAPVAPPKQDAPQ